MSHSHICATFFAAVLTCQSAVAEDLKPIPEGQSDTSLVRVYLVSGDYVSITVAEVDSEAFARIAVDEQPTLQAASYRLSADHKSCEAFAPIGRATKISDTQLAIQLDDKSRGDANLIAERFATADDLQRQAIMLLPGATTPQNHAGTSIADFAASVQPQIDAGGLIAYPVSLGVQPKAVTCKCKAFFGCTSGCCTNPTCKVIIGICQSNSACKKVDLTSNCSCRE